MSRASTHASRPRVGEVLVAFEPLESRLLLASLLVTNVNDSGSGSLRQAILDANATAGPSTIGFDIPGSGLHRIADPGGLPNIVVAADIDARTQPGYSGTPLVEIDGMNSYQGISDVGLTFYTGSTGASVEGLAIVRFYADGIDVLDQGGVTIRADDIGFDPSGQTPSPGNNTGIYVASGSNVVIGGPTAADGNVIASSFKAMGIAASSFNGSGIDLDIGSQITIQNNIIGTDPTLTADLGNPYDGILISDIISGASILSNTIANSGFRAIDDLGIGTTTSGNVLINNNANLATLVLSPSTATVAASEGKTATITYTITNSGPQAASNVQFTTETGRLYYESLSAGGPPPATLGPPPSSLISVGSVTPSQGSVDDTFVANSEAATVSLGSLAVGASATVTVLVNANTAGADGLVANASSDQFTLDRRFLQPMSLVGVNIAGRPDLSAVALPPSGTAMLGVPYTFRFVVTNHDTTGLVEAGFTVTNTPGLSSTLDSVTPSTGSDFSIVGPFPSPAPYSYYSPGDLGQLAPGASAMVSVTITPTRPGPLVVLFATSPANASSALDVNPGDNLALAGVSVLLSPQVSKTTLAPAKGDIQSVLIGFDAPLIAKTANNLRDYSLVTTGPGKPATVGLRAARYNPKTHVVALTLGHPLSTKGNPLKLTLSGLAGTDGSKLPTGTDVIMLDR